MAEVILDFEEEPTTAEDYLARVRWEAQHCPQVVRVEYTERAGGNQSRKWCGRVDVFVLALIVIGSLAAA